MQVLHGRRTQDNEKPHPERGTLERNHLVGFPFFGLVVGFENHRIEEKGQKAEHEEELDKKDREVFGVVLNA
jgi:hypothetical protein